MERGRVTLEACQQLTVTPPTGTDPCPTAIDDTYRAPNGAAFFGALGAFWSPKNPRSSVRSTKGTFPTTFPAPFPTIWCVRLYARQGHLWAQLAQFGILASWSWKTLLRSMLRTDKIGSDQTYLPKMCWLYVSAGSQSSKLAQGPGFRSWIMSNKVSYGSEMFRIGSMGSTSNMTASGKPTIQCWSHPEAGWIITWCSKWKVKAQHIKQQQNHISMAGKRSSCALELLTY